MSNLSSRQIDLSDEQIDLSDEQIDQIAGGLARVLIKQARYILEHGRDTENYQEADRIDTEAKFQAMMKEVSQRELKFPKDAEAPAKCRKPRQ